MFTEADLDLIRWTVARFSSLSRWELAQTICENLPWQAPNGQLRVHECLPLLEQLNTAGIIALPAKRARAPYHDFHGIDSQLSVGQEHISRREHSFQQRNESLSRAAPAQVQVS